MASFTQPQPPAVSEEDLPCSPFAPAPNTPPLTLPTISFSDAPKPYLIASWTTAYRQRFFATSGRIKTVLSSMLVQPYCQKVDCDNHNEQRAWSFFTEISPDKYLYAGMKSEVIYKAESNMLDLQVKGELFGLGMIMAAEVWKEYALLITSTRGLVIIDLVTMKVLISVENFIVWIYYLRYKYHNTCRNLDKIDDGVFFLVDDCQNLSILELREIEDPEQDKQRAEHFGSEKYFVQQTERGKYITVTMNHFSPQKGMAHFSVLKNRVSVLKTNGLVHNFEVKRPLNSHHWEKSPTSTWQFRHDDLAAEFTTISLSTAFVCAASYSLPAKLSQKPNLRAHEATLFVATSQDGGYSKKLVLSDPRTLVPGPHSDYNPVHSLRYFEYKYVPLVICLHKFDYIHVVSVNKRKQLQLVYTNTTRLFGRTEYTGMIQLSGKHQKHNQNTKFAIIGPMGYQLVLNFTTPEFSL